MDAYDDHLEMILQRHLWLDFCFDFNSYHDLEFMRRALPKLSYYVKKEDYYLPDVFPDCEKYLNRWVFHVMHKHKFTVHANLDVDYLDHIHVKGDPERWVIMIYFVFVWIQADFSFSEWLYRSSPLVPVENDSLSVIRELPGYAK